MICIMKKLSVGWYTAAVWEGNALFWTGCFRKWLAGNISARSNVLWWHSLWTWYGEILLHLTDTCMWSLAKECILRKMKEIGDDVCTNPESTINKLFLLISFFTLPSSEAAMIPFRLRRLLNSWPKIKFDISEAVLVQVGITRLILQLYSIL